MNTVKPLQRLPEAKKNREWKMETLEYLCKTNMTSIFDADLYKILSLCSGKMDESEYNPLLNPFNLKEQKFKRRASKVLNFEFISSIFLQILSEFRQRNLDPIVYAKNSNFSQIQQEEEQKLIIESLQQQFVNGLIESGQFMPNQIDPQTQQLVQPPLSPEVIKSKVTSIPDMKTIMGQRALDYIRDHQQLDANMAQCFDYFVKINRCFTYRGVRNGIVFHHVVSPLKAEFQGNRNVRFLENSEVIRVKYKFTLSEFMDIFGDTLEDYESEYPGIVKHFEEYNGNYRSGTSSDGFMATFYKSKGESYNEDVIDVDSVEVTHVQWTSQKKIGLVYEGEDIVEVDEDYPFEDVIEWTWRAEEREGWCVNNTYYLGGDPLEHQLIDPDDKFKTRKNYNGRIFMFNEDVRIPTLGEKLYVYQFTHNALKWKINDTLYKNKDKFTILPISLFGKGNGMNTGITSASSPQHGVDIRNSMDTFDDPSARDTTSNPIAESLYFLDAVSLLLVDDSQTNAQVASQMIKSVDMNLGNYIQWMINYQQQNKAEAEELVGFNRQRKGQINSSDGLGNTQQAVYTGGLVTEEYMKEFEEFVNSEYQALIDYSKFAFKTGERRTYIRSNTDVQLLELDEGFFESVYGVFTAASGKTKEVLQELKTVASELIQNGFKHSVFAKMLTSTQNYSSIIQEIEEHERSVEEQQQAANEQQQQLMSQKIEADDKRQSTINELKKYEIDMKTQVEILKVTQILYDNAQTSGDDKGIANFGNIQNQLTMHINDIKLKMLQENNKLTIAREKNEATKYVADKDERVARINPG